MTQANFDLWLFTHDFVYGAAAVRAGAKGVIVDWEWQDKAARQRGRDTEVNHGTEADLRTMRSVVNGLVACRVNNQPGIRVSETARAAELGADEVWLPMVRSISEIEECLAVLPSACKLSILAETPEALALAAEFNQLPLARVYLGLNDLWVTSKRRHLFTALIDGTAQKFRAEFHGLFGMAGVTRPMCGAPVPCELLLGEMARIGCNFGVARRAFRRDTPQEDLSLAVTEISRAMKALAERNDVRVDADRAALVARVREAEAQEAAR